MRLTLLASRRRHDSGQAPPRAPRPSDFWWPSSADVLWTPCTAYLPPQNYISLRRRQIITAVIPPSVWPHLFRGAGHEKRRGEQLKWSLAFRRYIGSFPCAQLPGPAHTAWLGRVFFCIFSLGLCFVCSFVLFFISFMFPWAVESSPLQFLALA